MIISFPSIYITKPGFKDGIIKFIKIVGWYIGCGAVTVATAYYQNHNIIDKENGAIFGSLMILNAAIAGASKWLSTNKPEGAIDIKSEVVDTDIIG